MRITITNKNRGHIMDILRKFFKTDDIIILEPFYDSEHGIICINFKEIIYDGSGIDIFIQYNFLKDTILRTYHLFIPFNSKIELKGTTIKLKLKDYGNISNHHTFRIMAQAHDIDI